MSSVRVRGDALCGFGAMVFFEQLQVDIGGRGYRGYRICCRRCRRVGGFGGGCFSELGLHELGELGEVDTWNVAML
ncbi:hypothetical protein [Phormidium nigroviride]